MTFDPHAIHIYTDGSCYKNPGGNAGCAAIVSYPDHLYRDEEQIFDIGCSESSNNRMELLACIRALEWARANTPWPNVTRVLIITDSRYVKDNLFRARVWKKNKWRNVYGEPKENSDLWNQLLSAQTKAGILVNFECTKGKKSPILKAVDKAAKAAAQRGGMDIDRGYKPGSVSRSMVKAAATRFSAQGQTVVVRPYRKNLMRGGENKVRFNVANESQVYVESGYAYSSPELAAELHRHHAYRVRFNDDPRYPKIVEIIEEVGTP